MTRDRSLPGWLPSLGVAAALAALVIWSFWQRWTALAASPFPLGIDGYFYPVQLRSLLEHGSLEFPASPLAFWLLAPFAAATDPITGAKLGSAVLGALVALPAYGVGAHLGRDGDDTGRGPGLVAATIATASAGSLYLTVEFVKNGIGITVALTALWLVLRALAVPTRGRLALAVVGIGAAVLTHKMAAAIVVGIAIPAALAEAHVRAQAATVEVRAKRRLVVLGAFVAIVGALFAIGLVAPRRFVSPGDLALLDGMFTTDADWSLPVLDGKLRLGWEPLLAVIVALGAAAALIVDRGDRRGRLALAGTILATIGALIALGCAWLGRDELAIAAPLGAVGIAALVGGALLWRHAERLPAPTATARVLEGSTGRTVVAWCVIALAVFIGLPWLDTSSVQGLAMRLRVVAFVPLALCAAIALRVVLRYAMPLFDGPKKPTRTTVCAVVAAGVVVLHLGGNRVEGQILAHPALVASSQALSGKLPADAVAIVPERHIAFMVAWYARVPVSTRPDGIPDERRWRVLPGNYIRRAETLDAALFRIRGQARVIGLHPSHPNGMVALPEATWRALQPLLSAEDRELFVRWPTI